MADEERSTISNAIWLCRDCHGLIDKDQHRFSAELLFLWKEEHEAKITKEIGLPAELLRLRIAQKEAQEFDALPPLARSLVRDRPEYWEFMLAAELLDELLRPTMRRSRDLEAGLVSKPFVRMSASAFLEFTTDKSSELGQVVQTLSNLLSEIARSFGPPGVAGDPHEIIHACELYASCAARFVDIAEEVTFAKPPEGLERVGTLMAQGALHPVRKLPEVAAFIRAIFDQPRDTRPKGTYSYTMTVDLPKGWANDISRELRRAAKRGL